MKVKELIDLLQYEVGDMNMEVVFKPSNSYYVEALSDDGINICKLNSFYGKDRDAVVIYSDGQVGSV